MDLKLYSRYRNSAGQRVRTALNIKNIPYEYIVVETVGMDNSVPQTGKSISKEDYNLINPQGLMPTLVINGERVVQSSALVEFIEDAFEGPSLFPKNLVARARSRAFSQVIACEMHAVGVRRIRRNLMEKHGFSEEELRLWYENWLHHGYKTLETLMMQRAEQTPFCYDDKPTIGDIYLVPQLYNSRLFEIDLSAYPTLCDIEQRCREIPAFEKAMPYNQPDYPESPEGFV
tara:strand:+ start:4574 stop:5266 length:693 start_codon:yes stop_codon:yes gene_type:complete